MAPISGNNAPNAPKDSNPFTSMMRAGSAIRKDALIVPKSAMNATAAAKNNGGRGNQKSISEKLLAMVAKLPKIPVRREIYTDAAKLAVVEIVAECGSIDGAVKIFKRQKLAGYENISWASADRWVKQSAKVISVRIPPPINCIALFIILSYSLLHYSPYCTI